jgi:CRP-like cAMP-binding protein
MNRPGAIAGDFPSAVLGYWCGEQKEDAMSQTNAKARDILKTKSVLAALPDAALDGLIARARLVSYPKGVTLYHRGDASDSLMIILSGRVKIANVAGSAREIVLNILGAGDLNGELGALDGLPRSADAIALEPTEALLVMRRDILPVLKANAEASLGVVVALSKKLRQVSAMAEHALLSMPGRAASGLLRLADLHGKPGKGGVLIDVKLSQKDLGNFLGLSRENTSRELSRLRDLELIRVDGAMITIPDPDALRDFADAESDPD